MKFILFKTAQYEEFFNSINTGHFFKNVQEFTRFLLSLSNQDVREQACELFCYNILRIINTQADYEQLFFKPVLDRRLIYKALENAIELAVTIFKILENQRITPSIWKNTESELPGKMDASPQLCEKMIHLFCGHHCKSNGTVCKAWQQVLDSNGDIKSLIILVHLDAFEIGLFSKAEFFGQKYTSRQQLESEYQKQGMMIFDTQHDPLLNTIKRQLLPLDPKANRTVLLMLLLICIVNKGC